MFANSLEPLICPVLAVAVLIFTMGWRQMEEGAETSNVRLFGNGEASEKRYSSWLVDALKEADGEFALLHLAIKEIGSHSLREGIVTELARLVGGPSIIAIFKRVGWSLGMKDRYVVEKVDSYS